MRKILLFSVIQQLLYHISKVESLMGQNISQIRGGEFPFVASFQYFPEGHNFCGGALITKKHVLTSAACLEDKSVESFRIIFEIAHAQEPAVAYTAASWTTYVDWVNTQGIPYNHRVSHLIAIVELSCRVYNINPVPLNGLTKRQLDGKAAKMIGWRNNVLSKTTVLLLNDEECEISVRVLIPGAVAHDRTLCSTANPFALLEFGDMGSPLLHARDNSLLGIAFGCSPNDINVQGNFSTAFIRQHQINVHSSVHYYRLFIYSVIPAAPAA